MRTSAAASRFDNGIFYASPKFAGFQANVAYSAGMAGHGGKWTYDSINKFITSPKGFVPGTAMGFAGISKDSERADLIAYLTQVGPLGPAQQPGDMGMGGGELPDLKQAGPQNRVTVWRDNLNERDSP